MVAAICGVVVTIAGYAAQPANTAWPCRTWVDPVLRVRFPERLGGLPLFSTAAGGMLTVRFTDHAFTVETFLSPPEVTHPEPNGI